MSGLGVVVGCPNLALDGSLGKVRKAGRQHLVCCGAYLVCGIDVDIHKRGVLVGMAKVSQQGEIIVWGNYWSTPPTFSCLSLSAIVMRARYSMVSTLSFVHLTKKSSAT